MSKLDYARVAADAIGMPHVAPTPPPSTDLLPVGEWQVADHVEAIAAIADRRVAIVREVLDRLRQNGLADEGQKLETSDFLTYSEYLTTLKRLPEIHQTLLRQGNSQRRREFDQAERQGKKYFYPKHDAPEDTELYLYRHHDPARHTPDIQGYMAYASACHPPISDLFFWKLPALIPEKDRELHTYITGSSGAGKSELMKVLIDSYVRWDNPPCIVVIDPHGKFADEVAQQNEVVASGRLIYINPSLSKNHTPTINPFNCYDPERAEYIGKQLLGLFELLFMQENSGELSGNMRVLLNAMLPALLRMPGSDILTLQQLLSSNGEDRLFREMLLAMEPQQRDFIKADWKAKSFETTKESLRKKIQTVASTPFLRFVCGENSIDLDAAIRSRSIICLSLSKGDLDTGTIKAMGAFFLATIQAYVYAKTHERPEGDPRRVPIHIFVDECQNFVSPTFKEILTEARKFGLHLTLAQQFAGFGMDDPELKKAVLGNTGVKIAGFNNEAATWKVMAREMRLDEEALIGLEKHRFYVKTTQGRAFKLIPPTHLISARSRVDAATWRQVTAEQLARFYRPIEAETPTTGTKLSPADHLTPPPPDFA